jgi:hypothetical protein
MPLASEKSRVGLPLVHELRNLVNTAIVAFEVLKTGQVGVSGNTGTVLLAVCWGCETSSPSH